MREPKALSRDNNEEAKTRHKSPGSLGSNSRGSSEEGEIEDYQDTKDNSVEPGNTDDKKRDESTENSNPPLPSEPPPGTTQEVDDGWAPIWDKSAQGFYFYNRFTGASQWTNPRVPEASAQVTSLGLPGDDISSRANPTDNPPAVIKPGYNPAIHGDYDPTAWYAQPAQEDSTQDSTFQNSDARDHYIATAAFNRFTGRFQNPEITPENFNDENKSKRQMNAYFDVDAAANSHDGRSLKAERSGKKLSKTELKQFKEKRKMKKEERRRAWLRD
ncbi:hypothetical protein HI914_02549 [Erysiphe necator]|nr:hypothetical protein HI914_02549 [Erysiphe necator]